MTLPSTIDQPAAGALSDPLALRIEGWLYAGDRHAQLKAVEIRCGAHVLGETSILYVRPDVTRSLGIEGNPATGFSLLLSAPELLGCQSARLECLARFRDGSVAPGVAREIQLIPHDHRENHYGVLVRPDETRLFHRSDIYTSGASVSEINPDCLALIQRHLGAPRPTGAPEVSDMGKMPMLPRTGVTAIGSEKAEQSALHRVLDVGCGFGGYGRALIAAGYDWLGVEVKESDCVELARLGLPHQKVDGRSLPFAATSFDAAICVEVLEHIAAPEEFLAEIRRVVRKRLLVSVPNLELIPYLHRYAVVPWHLLEGDHKNFFTRPSLRTLLSQFFRSVEVLSYAPIPLRTPEGIPLHNHLFAICDV